MKIDIKTPYNDLPLLPPAADLETEEVLKKVISASRTLAELKGLGEPIPDQNILINSIVLQEAKASSEIENIITTSDALYQALSSSSETDPVTKEVLRYREALWKAFTGLKDRPMLTTNLFIAIVHKIKQAEIGIRKTHGTHLQNDRTGEIVYTPPEGEETIRAKLANLEEYIHADDGIDPLIKAAVIHYQFEAIHTFPDGNGRTGRIIILLYLIVQNLLNSPILYISKYITETKSEYYRLLRRVTFEDDWASWILYVLSAIEKTAAFTRDRILSIRSLLKNTAEEIRTKLPDRVYSKDLLECIFEHPYTRVQFLVDRGVAKRQTAAEYLKLLESAGILRSVKRGREVFYINIKLFDLLADGEITKPEA